MSKLAYLLLVKNLTYALRYEKMFGIRFGSFFMAYEPVDRGSYRVRERGSTRLISNCNSHGEKDGIIAVVVCSTCVNISPARPRRDDVSDWQPCKAVHS